MIVGNKDTNLVQQYLSTDEAQKLLSVLDDPKQKELFLNKLKETLSDTIFHHDNSVFSFFKSFLNMETFGFFLQRTLRIVLILLLSVVLWKILNYIIQKAIYHLPGLKKIHKSRHAALMKTVLPIIRSALKWVFGTILVLVILSELSINIAPILLSFSVIGLAISIGSQTLVRDLINGFLSLLEGNMTVSDMVTIGIRKGVVESLSLRCVYLRHPTGELETIPFSEVGCIINHSRDYAVVKIQVVLSHEARFPDVKSVFDNVFLDLHKTYHSSVMGDFQFLGVQDLTDVGVTFFGIVKIAPDPKKTFETEFKNRLLQKIQEHTEWLPKPRLG